MAEFEPKFIDTHSHVNFNAFKDDGDAVIQRALDAGVGIIMPGSQIDTSKRAVEYAEKYNHPYIRAAVGLHPIHLEDIEIDDSEVEGQAKFHTRKEEFRRAAYEDIIKSSDPSTGSGHRKVVAIGEVGLDYWRVPGDPREAELYKEMQMDTLNSQLDLAVDYNLPVILHCRKAHDDLLSIVESHGVSNPPNGRAPGVVHCYTGSKDQLNAFLALGWYIGYNGIIFKLNLENVIKETPLDRMLLETDSPYLTPPIAVQAGAKEGRNEPIFVKYVAEKIAEIKQVSVEEVARQTTENAKKVFGLLN